VDDVYLLNHGTLGFTNTELESKRVKDLPNLQFTINTFVEGGKTYEVTVSARNNAAVSYAH